MKNPLTPRQKMLHARFKAMGIALILHPLKLVLYRDSHLEIDPITRVQTLRDGPRAAYARVAARMGNGADVRLMARSFL